MLVDAFLGYDEIELGMFRVKYLSGLVSHTIIAESDTSHRGSRKQLFFSEYLSNNKKSQPSIEVLNLDLNGYKDGWSKEIASRELLANYLYSKYPNCFFILSDLDEIPSHQQVRLALKANQNLHFLSPTFYRRANWQLSDQHRDWAHGVIGHTSRPIARNGSRFEKLEILSCDDNGAHLSYLAKDENAVLKKFSRVLDHGTDFEQIQSKELISLADKFQVDHIGRFFAENHGLLNNVPIDKLSSVQRELLKQHPQFFCFTPTNKWRMKRLYVSLLITLIRKYGYLEGPQLHKLAQREASFSGLPLFFKTILKILMIRTFSNF